MRISDTEVKKLLALGEEAIDITREEGAPDPKADTELVARLTDEIVAMPDREDRIAELKAAIASGTYNPTGDEIADAMIRRNIADRIRG